MRSKVTVGWISIVLIVSALLALLPATAVAASGGRLCLDGSDFPTTVTGLTMAPGTSPAIAPNAGGSGSEIAFQSSAGHLVFYFDASGAGADSGFDMEPGTSPAISSSGGSVDTAFSAAGSDELYVGAPSQETSTGQIVEAGTSPAVAAVSASSAEYAYMNPDSGLETGDGTSWTNNQFGSEAGTSPAITADNGTWESAEQDNQTALEFVGPVQDDATGQGMESDTSPSIAALGTSPDFEGAFQSNGNVLYVWGSTEDADTTVGMAPGTNPAITALGSGTEYEIAVQGTNGDLWVYSGNGTADDTGQAMAPGTSPAITQTSTGGYQVAYQCAAAAAVSPAPTQTVTTTAPAPAPTTNPVTTTPLPTAPGTTSPGKKKPAPRVRVRFRIDAHWNGRVTHLVYVRPVKKLPRGALITFICTGVTAKRATKHTKAVVAEHCPRLGKLPAKRRTTAKELAVVAGRTFPRNVVLTIAVAVKGYSTERIAITLTARGKQPPESLSWK